MLQYTIQKNVGNTTYYVTFIENKNRYGVTFEFVNAFKTTDKKAALLISCILSNEKVQYCVGCV